MNPALRALLADGEWHTLRALYYNVVNLIRPEMAAREFHRRFDDPRSFSLSHRIQEGSRHIVVRALWRLGAEKRCIFDLDDTWGVEYRLPSKHA